MTLPEFAQIPELPPCRTRVLVGVRIFLIKSANVNQKSCAGAFSIVRNVIGSRDIKSDRNMLNVGLGQVYNGRSPARFYRQ
jgi:hypothetical protein